MAFMLSRFKVPLSWKELLRLTFDEAFFKDNCLGMAAQLAYYFFFALFPALLVVLVIASYFFENSAEFVSNMFVMAHGLVPQEALQIITEQLVKISENQAGLLTVGMLTALWSSSAAMTAIIDTLNSAYDIQEGRAWWRVLRSRVSPVASAAATTAV